MNVNIKIDSFKVVGGLVEVEHCGTLCTRATFHHAGKTYSAFSPEDMQQYLNAVCRAHYYEMDEDEQREKESDSEIDNDVFIAETMNER
jgi:hypothetical protein